MKLEKHTVHLPVYWPRLEGNKRHLIGWLLPSPGNVLFTLLVAGGLLWATSAGALPLRAPTLAGDSTTTISYQGRLADSSGNPVTTSGVGMQFRLYNTDTNGSPLWEESHTAVPVEDGLFHVLLGSTNPIPVSLLASNGTLWLGITVGSDSEMTPREQIASVPYAMIGSTVPDRAITTAKLADGAVTSAKLNVDNGLGMNGNLTVTGNVTLAAGWKQILFSDPGNCDFSIVHNGGVSLDFRSPECGGGTRALGILGDGNVLIPGSLSAGGAKSAVVNTAHHGQRTLYAAESPEMRFFDEDLARLKDGMARVMLDPVFLETIEGDFLVHVTPYGDASLYVDQIGKDYFVVKARDGDPNVAFAWRLSAHRKGYAGVRLEAIAAD